MVGVQKKPEYCSKIARLFEIFNFLRLVKMPRKVAKKIYKVKRKEIDDSKDNFVVKFKGLSKAEIKELRSDLDEFLKHYLEPPVEEEKSEY